VEEQRCPHNEQEGQMVIVGGEFEVDPDQRAAFVASRVATMIASRAEPGCLEYTFAPDPAVATRVVLYERWESQEALDAHLAAPRDTAEPDTAVIRPTSSSIMVYEVASERPLR
jgi:quinol monooxygenase YgiN